MPRGRSVSIAARSRPVVLGCKAACSRRMRCARRACGLAVCVQYLAWVQSDRRTGCRTGTASGTAGRSADSAAADASAEMARQPAHDDRQAHFAAAPVGTGSLCRNASVEPHGRPLRHRRPSSRRRAGSPRSTRRTKGTPECRRRRGRPLLPLPMPHRALARSSHRLAACACFVAIDRFRHHRCSCSRSHRWV